MTTSTTSRNGTKPKAEPIAPATPEGAPEIPAGTPSVQVSRIARERMIVPIRGTAPLMMSKFSTKAKQQMLDAQQGQKQPRANRNPGAEYEAALYRLPKGDDGTDRYGFPVVAFKASMVGAARFYRSVKMTEIRQFVFFRGEDEVTDDGNPQQLAVITGTPHQREDVVRLAGASRSADLRYRPEFPTWSTELDITYVASCISRESVLSLLDAAGMGVGVGEWRPERSGVHGTFEIDATRPLTVFLPNGDAEQVSATW